MKWIALLVISVALVAGCTQTDSAEELTVDEKIVGTWGWSYQNTTAYYIFFENKTLITEAYKNGEYVSGNILTYDINNYSTIRMDYALPEFKQGPSNGTFYMYYRFLDDDTLELTALGVTGWNLTRQK